MSTSNRPRRPRLDVPLNMLLSAGEKRAFEDAATLAGLSLSAWVRSRLRDYAIAELGAAEKPVAFLEASA